MGEVIVYKERQLGGRWQGLTSVVGLLLAASVLCAVCGGLWFFERYISGEAKAVNTSETESHSTVTFIIDPGHGGIDSGAVSADGTVEKELNLAVAKKLAELMRVSGIDFVMTREDDRMLVDDSIKDKRKMHDLKNRLAVANDIVASGGEAVLISIHMNKFSSPKYSGLQVWYSDNEQSASIASDVQSYSRTWLAPDNDRQTKRATSSIYILDRASMPAILVECGFLSNPDECANLKTNGYQCKLAAVIFAALSGYVTNSTQ